jgi:phosphoglycolate phosphatase-like HAD superfamily hydrolase
MKLILFDIDGTLLTTNNAGRAAMRSAGADVFAIEEDLEGVAVSGNTDVAIVREILKKHGITDSEINVNRYLGAYLAHLKQRLVQQPGGVLPGVEALLDACAQDGCVVGLLTGNIKRGAQIKLGAHHLWDRFSVGAFADDSQDRNMLGPIAKNRAEAEFQTAFDELFIIGDTPRDVVCGKAANAIVLAVATGRYSRENLTAHRPDYLFDDLSETQAVLAALGLDRSLSRPRVGRSVPDRRVAPR